MGKETRNGRARLLVAGLLGFDFILLAAVFGAALWIRFSSGLHGSTNPFPWYQVKYAVLVGVGLVWLAIFQAQGLYRTTIYITGVRQVLQLLKGVTIGILVYILLSYLLKSGYVEQSRLVIGYIWVFSFLALAGFRCLIFRPLAFKIIRAGVLKRVLVVGAGESGVQYAQSVKNYKELGMEVVGFIDDNIEKQGQEIAGLPVLGKVNDVNTIVPDQAVDEIYIAISTVGHERLLEIISRCRDTGLPVRVISDLYDVITSKIDVEQLAGVPLVEIKDRSLEYSNLAVKRLIDLIIALAGLVLLGPFIIVIAILIKVTSPGPIFFKQVRIGKNGRRFALYKFRTMVLGADDAVHREYLKNYINGGLEKQPEDMKLYKLTNDARVTRVGSSLRKFSIDELPQLINVLKGEMSLVGPRPCLPYESDSYKPWHKRRFTVQPGITGLWQVSGRSSVKFNDMIMLDLYYIENMSLWFDLQIILKTVPIVVTGKGGH